MIGFCIVCPRLASRGRELLTGYSVKKYWLLRFVLLERCGLYNGAGYIPIGQDRDEPRGNRQQIAWRESRARRPAPLWIRAAQVIDKGASSRPASSGSFAVIVSPAHSPVLGQGWARCRGHPCASRNLVL